MTRRIIVFIGIIVIVIAIPITVLLLLRRTQIQKRAAVPEGLTTVTLDPATNTYNVGDSFDVDIKVNTAGIGTSVITVYLTYTYDDVLELEVQDTDGNTANGTQIQPGELPLNYITNDVTIDEPTKKVIIRLAALISDPEQPYYNTSDAVFGTITFKALAPVESRTISFDQELSKITHAETAEDILLIPTNAFYTIKGATTLQPPKITGFTPTSGKIGTTVTIDGENFGGQKGTSTVKFANTEAVDIDSWSDTAISVKVPQAAQTGKIVITTAGGTATSSDDFTVLSDEEEVPPLIDFFIPFAGSIWDKVLIFGSNFADTQGLSTVTFKDTPATDYEAWADDVIVTFVPEGAETGKITVTTSGGSATSSESFIVITDEEEGQPPEISTFRPQSGEVGTKVYIGGNYFGYTQGASTVKFNDVEATNVSYWSNTLIEVFVPTGATTGKISVITGSGTATSADDFVVTEPGGTPPEDVIPPTITSVSASTITETSANITWSTNETATSQVEYGTTNAYGDTTVKDTSYKTNHTVTLTGLISSTTYHFRVKSEDATGNQATSADYTFTTTSPPPPPPAPPPADTTPPVISNVSALEIATTSAKITWATDESATSQVEYGATETYDNSTVKDTTTVTTHTVLLSGLSPDTLYHYRVISEDSTANQSQSADYTFTTAQEGVGGPGEEPGSSEEGGELPETGIGDYANISLILGGILILLGLAIPKFALGFENSTKERRLKKFERKIRDSS